MPRANNIGVIMSGASGSKLAYHALKLLAELQTADASIKIHLIITSGGARTAGLELTETEQEEIPHLADYIHNDEDLAASIASGSNALDALLIVPCSVRTLSAIAYGQTDRLSVRAADVMLKERRRLVLALRESPLHQGHLQSMLQVTQMGGIIAPPVPALYLAPQSIDEMLQQNAARLLSLLGLDVSACLKRWETPPQQSPAQKPQTD